MGSIGNGETSDNKEVEEGETEISDPPASTTDSDMDVHNNSSTLPSDIEASAKD